MLLCICKSMRPKQWTKNLCVFAGLAFSQNIMQMPYMIKTISAFIVFCLLSGSVYILNDLTDLEKDRHHPIKSRRPIASGSLSVFHAQLTLATLLPGSLVGAFFLGMPFFLVAIAYVILQVMYSFFLKNVVILDAMTVACGFVLRVVAGALVISVEISSWLLVCTMFLALFLSLSKRRHETIIIEDNDNHRKTWDEYSPYLLDQMITIVSASTIVSYALYSMSAETVAKVGTRHLIYTVPFVLYGILRYLYLIYRKGAGGNPETVLVTDVPLIINIVLWTITTGVILYVR